MSSYAALGFTTWLAGYDFTTDLNALAVAFGWEALDTTTFGSAGTRVARSRIAGLETDSSELTGLHQAGAGLVDAEAFTGLGSTTQVITHSVDGAEGSVAYAYQARKLRYQLFGALGQPAPFTLAAQGSRASAFYGAVRGQVAKARGNVSATGQLGSILGLGAPSSTQFVYATVHIFSAGTTITIQVQSDDAAGFSSPTTRATIGPLTAAGGTWMTRVAGPFAGETHWRCNVSAITGTFDIAAMIAVDRNPT